MDIVKAVQVEAFTDELTKIAYDEHAASENRKLDKRSLIGGALGAALGAGIGGGANKYTAKRLGRLAAKKLGRKLSPQQAKELMHVVKAGGGSSSRRALMGGAAGLTGGAMAGAAYHGSKSKDENAKRAVPAAKATAAGAAAGLAVGHGVWRHKLKKVLKRQGIHGSQQRKAALKAMKADKAGKLFLANKRLNYHGAGAALGTSLGALGGMAWAASKRKKD